MIENSEQLLEEALKIQDVEARTKFIMNYFLENVKYNYACLFAKGYTGAKVFAVERNFGLAVNKTKVDGDEDYSLTRSILMGKSKIFDDILRIRDENEGSYEGFVEQLKSYITAELKSHLDNDSIVEENVNVLMRNIENGLREKMKVNIQGNECDLNYDISKVLIDFILEPKKFFPPEFNNGLITNGVCADYTDFLVPFLQKAGIETHSAEGKSEFSHAWIIVKNGEQYKSIDLTRAVFIRDGGIGIPEGQTSEAWLYSDLEDMFKMQQTRSITKIDGNELPNAINGQNFDEDAFIRIMQENDREDATLENATRKALKNGATKKESLTAENAERLNEREDIINE